MSKATSIRRKVQRPWHHRTAPTITVAGSPLTFDSCLFLFFFACLSTSSLVFLVFDLSPQPSSLHHSWYLTVQRRQADTHPAFASSDPILAASVPNGATPLQAQSSQALLNRSYPFSLVPLAPQHDQPASDWWTTHRLQVQHLIVLTQVHDLILRLQTRNLIALLQVQYLID